MEADLIDHDLHDLNNQLDFIQAEAVLFRRQAAFLLLVKDQARQRGTRQEAEDQQLLADKLLIYLRQQRHRQRRPKRQR